MQTMTAVRMRGISKRYMPSGIYANRGAELEVARGSIHAIVGENGAGKTTLMKILAGLESPDAGEIEIEGEPVIIGSSARARDLGIGMVHQHFLMFDELSAAENIYFGMEPERTLRGLRLRGVIHASGLNEQTQKLAGEYGFTIDPSAQAGELSVSVRQQIEILRQLARDMSILILDEPTSVLTEQETRAFFEKLSEIRHRGRTILLVTHKIDEVMQIADRVTVMRQGETIGTYATASTSTNELAHLIMGSSSYSDLQERTQVSVQRAQREKCVPLLQIKGLSTRHHHQNGNVLTDISIDAYEGEVLGICALSGNGLDELEDVLAGFTLPAAGTCIFGGKRFEIRKLHEYRRLFTEGHIAYLPSDRMRRAAALSLSVKDNFIALDRRSYFPKGWMRATLAESTTLKAIRAFKISARPEQPTAELSGGNIQKLAIARLFSRENSRLMVLCEPTWGLDIRSAEMAHEKIQNAGASGSAILLLSSDIDEILKLSDRVMLLYRGRQVLVCENSEHLSRSLIGEYLLGTRSA